MKTAIQWIIPAVALAASGGCVATSGEMSSRTFNFDGFDSVSASAGVNVVLKEGPYSVRADAPKERLERIIVEREGSTLVVRQEAQIGWVGSWRPSIVTVVAPSFAKIESFGGADVDASSLNGKALEMRAAGGGDINADAIDAEALMLTATGGGDINVRSMKSAKLDVKIGGGGDITVSGTCTSLAVEAGGGGDFDAKALTCSDGLIEASGGADADVTLTSKASARAHSGSDIRIRGNPSVVETNESGGGDIEIASSH